MNISGENVLLRAIDEKDCELLREMMNDSETEYFLGGWSFPLSKADQQNWFESQHMSKNTLRVMIDTGDITVGTAILSDIDYKNGSAQIHIKLHGVENRHKGYGTDAITALCNYAFMELRLHCIYAEVSQHNIPSQRLFAKCGFEQEGVLRDRLFKKGKYIDVVLFSKLGGSNV